MVFVIGFIIIQYKKTFSEKYIISACKKWNICSFVKLVVYSSVYSVNGNGYKGSKLENWAY